MSNEPKTGLAIPPDAFEKPTLNCHRFFAPVVFPEPDKLQPNRMNITPRMGNFACIKDKCMLWNAEDKECWDVTSAKSQKVQAEYAFNKMNDVHLENGGQ
jgi:hypothetical protein